MQDENENENENRLEITTDDRSTPLQGTIEWLGNKSGEIIRDKTPRNFPGWLLMPVIGLGLFFLIFVIFILLLLAGIYLFFRLLSLPFSSNRRTVIINKRIFKG